MTRPEPAATRFAGKLATLGIETFVEPLLTFRPLDAAIPDARAFDGLVLTSANTVQALSQEQAAALAATPTFCVGAKTARAALKAGIERIEATAQTARELAKHLTKPGAPKRLLHLGGEHKAFDFADALAPFGIAVTAVAVYTMDAASALTPALQDRLSHLQLDAVALMSPRTARVFVDAARNCGAEADAARLRALCLSPAVARCVEGFSGKIETASEPALDAFLTLILNASGRAAVTS